MTDSKDTEIPATLGMAATRLTKAFEAEFFRRLAETEYGDLRMRHTRLLEFLPEDGARLSTVAAYLGMTKQAVGEVVDDLEETKYIQRIDDPADRRAKLVIRSAKGDAAYRDAYAILDDMTDELSARVGKQRYREARGAMDEISALLEKTFHENV